MIERILAESVTHKPGLKDFDYFIIANKPVGVRLSSEDEYYLRVIFQKNGFANSSFEDRAVSAAKLAIDLGLPLDRANDLALLGHYMHEWEISEFGHRGRTTDSLALTIRSTYALK